MEKIPVAIFVRVSSKKQDYQRQISDLEKYAQRQDYEIVHVFKEVISASKNQNESRPVVTEMLKLAKAKKFKKLLISEVSRLGRKPSQIYAIMEELTELNISIYAQNFGMETLMLNGRRNPAASLIFISYADMARNEVEFLSDRIISGQQEARRRGQKLGRPVGTTTSEQKIIKKYPATVKLINRGLSIREISKINQVAINTVRKVKAAMEKLEKI